MDRWKTFVSVVTRIGGWIIGVAIGRAFTKLYGLAGLFIVAAACGLLYVAVCLKKRERPSAKAIFVVCLLIAVAGAGVWVQQPKTPVEKMAAKAGDLVSSDPLIASAFRGMSFEEARTKGAELSRRGVPRLDDETLRDRAGLMCKILQRLSEETCAAVAREMNTPEVNKEVVAAVATLDPADQQRWANLSMKAVRAQLLQTPVPVQDSTVVSNALEHLLGSFTEEQADAVISLYEKKATDAQAALAIRAMYSKSLEQPEPEATILARVLAGEEVRP